MFVYVSDVFDLFKKNHMRVKLRITIVNTFKDGANRCNELHSITKISYDVHFNKWQNGEDFG